MATLSAVNRTHILTAIAEYDDRGAEGFLGVYGFTPSERSTFKHEGRTYDAVAILGVAHRYATGRLATADEFTGGKIDPATVLRKHGFEAAGPTTSAPVRTPGRGARSTAATARSTSRSTSRRAAVEVPPAICPTCSMTLPATGICDDCG